MLLLDEPTNDLDIDTLAALEDLLDTWPGTMVVASHDRYLVERVADVVYGMFGDGKLVHLPGGVDEYLERIAGEGEGFGAGTDPAPALSREKAADLRASDKDARAAKKELAKLERSMRPADAARRRRCTPSWRSTPPTTRGSPRWTPSCARCGRRRRSIEEHGSPSPRSPDDLVLRMRSWPLTFRSTITSGPSTGCSASSSGLYMLVFGVVGFVQTSADDFFTQDKAEWVLGLRTNPAFSLLSLVAGRRRARRQRHRPQPGPPRQPARRRSC